MPSFYVITIYYSNTPSQSCRRCRKWKFPWWTLLVNIPRVNIPMVFSVKIICGVVRKVLFVWMLLYIKLPAFDLVSNPKQLNLHQAWSLFFHATIHNPYSCAVVTVYGGWQLLVAKFTGGQTCLTFLDIQEYCSRFCSRFCFCWWAHYYSQS